MNVKAAKACLLTLVVLIGLLSASGVGRAQVAPIPELNLSVGAADDPEGVAVTLQILALLTILSLAPAILVLMTSFTRIVIVLSFVRSALATQQMPPNQVIVGLALFLTFYVMAPTWQTINQQALQPFLAGEVNQSEALSLATEPMREFMFQHVRERDLALFIDLSDGDQPASPEDVATHALIPAFIISELKTAFTLGFIIFIPFLVIDMIIASTLMAMGMLMLPPIMISLPFKVLLFVLVDGWYLVVQSVVFGFQ